MKCNSKIVDSIRKINLKCSLSTYHTRQIPLICLFCTSAQKKILQRKALKRKKRSLLRNSNFCLYIYIYLYIKLILIKYCHNEVTKHTIQTYLPLNETLEVILRTVYIKVHLPNRCYRRTNKGKSVNVIPYRIESKMKVMQTT